MRVQLNGGVQSNSLQVDGARDATTPTTLGNARQGKSNVGRVVAAIFSFGLSEGVRALIHAVRASHAPAPQVSQQAAQELARPAADVLNSTFVDTLTRCKPLHPAMQQAIKEGLESLRSAFGDVVPTDGEAPYALRQALAGVIRKDSEEITPERLRAMVENLGKPVMAIASLQAQSQAVLQDEGYHPGQDITPAAITYLKHSPFDVMQREVTACQSATEVGAVLARYDAPIREHLNHKQEAEAYARDITADAYQRLSDASGFSKEALATTKVASKFDHSILCCIGNLTASANPLHGEALRAHISSLAKSIVDCRIEVFASVDRLAISPALKDDWKDSVMRVDTLKDPASLAKYIQSADTVNVDSLIRAFRDPDLSDDDTLCIFQSVALKLEQGFQSVFDKDDYAKFFNDPYTLENASVFGMMALFDKHPKLVEALHANPERLGRIADLAKERVYKDNDAGKYELVRLSKLVRFACATLPPTVAQANQKMAENLADETKIPLTHVDALRSAIAETRANFGAGSFAAGVNLAAMNESASGKVIIKNLAEQIKGLDHIVTAQEIKDMCKTAIRNRDFTSRLSCGILGEMAQGAGLHLDESVARRAFATLSARHPNLAANIAAAPNRGAVQALIQALPDAKDVIEFHTTMASVQAEAKERAFAEMAEVTGKTVDDMKAELNLTAVDDRFAVVTHNFEVEAHEPTNRLPRRMVIDAYYNVQMDFFIAEKKELYNVIATLTGVGEKPISPALKERMQHDVLSNISMKSESLVSKAAAIAAEINSADLKTPISANDAVSTKLAFLQIGKTFEHYRDVFFTEAEIDLFDPDDLANINRIVRQIFVDTDTDFVELLRNNEDFVRGIADSIENVDLRRITKEITRVDLTKAESIEPRREFGEAMIALYFIDEVLSLS